MGKRIINIGAMCKSFGVNDIFVLRLSGGICLVVYCLDEYTFGFVPAVVRCVHCTAELLGKLCSENSEPNSRQGPENDLLLLYKQEKSNYNRLIFSTLNANSIPNKLDDIRITIADFVDILVITESKLDQSSPESQFFINRFSKPFRKDRNRHSGRLLM